ncbi:hypothetical protein HPP92_006825 [Vanilla planifolia]|uniref:Uncharacterized protein n=1 Tax=Vanilla planifolia TaxID=51239 RepID=A0A835RQ44_VANPL|nr:hypothetical protein HPP92_006825 [Vanilla planifolia]
MWRRKFAHVGAKQAWCTDDTQHKLNCPIGVASIREEAPGLILPTRTGVCIHPGLKAAPGAKAAAAGMNSAQLPRRHGTLGAPGWSCGTVIHRAPWKHPRKTKKTPDLVRL